MDGPQLVLNNGNQCQPLTISCFQGSIEMLKACQSHVPHDRLTVRTAARLYRPAVEQRQFVYKLRHRSISLAQTPSRSNLFLAKKRHAPLGLSLWAPAQVCGHYHAPFSQDKIAIQYLPWEHDKERSKIPQVDNCCSIAIQVAYGQG